MGLRPALFLFLLVMGALFELSKIEVEYDSNHIHGAVAATGAALTKPIRVEHKARLIGELDTGRVFPLIPRVKRGVMKITRLA